MPLFLFKGSSSSSYNSLRYSWSDVRLANTQKTLKEIRKLSGQQGLFYLHLHDQWLILKQVLLQCHMHNSGHKESDQSHLPAFTTFLLELGFPFCAIDQPCNSATVLDCRQPRGIQRTKQQKDIPKRIKQPREKNCNSSSSSSNIRYLLQFCLQPVVDDYDDDDDDLLHQCCAESGWKQ